jgi:hypothetical protein
LAVVMPDAFELDEFIERLISPQKMKTGLSQLCEGKKKPHQELRQNGSVMAKTT